MKHRKTKFLYGLILFCMMLSTLPVVILGSLSYMQASLPSASLTPNRLFSISKTDASVHSVIVQPSGTDTISDSSRAVLTADGEHLTLISNGADGYSIM